jgi:hypothetical protein
MILPGSFVKALELASPEENQILHDVFEDKVHEIIGKRIREKRYERRGMPFMPEFFAQIFDCAVVKAI